MSITRDEWLRALAEAGLHTPDDDPSAMTAGEYAALMGLSIPTAATQLRRLVALGKAEQTAKWGVTSYGRRIQYRAYRIVAAKKTRK